MDFFERISRGLNAWVQAMVSSMGIAMAAIVAVQVFCRYMLNHSLFWSEELARLLLVWLTFFGATVAYYHGAHPGVDGLFRRLPHGWQTVLACLTHLACLSLFVVMIKAGIEFSWFVRLQITPALHLPKWVMMAVVPVSGFIFFVHGLCFLGRECSGKGRGHDH